VQQSLSRTQLTRGRPAPRPASLLAVLPYLAFFGWMVYKQRIALLATGIAPGPAMLWGSVAVLAVFTPWLVLAPGRWQAFLALLLDLFITFMLYADILYWRQFGDLVSVASLRFAGQLTSVGGAVAILVQQKDLWLFVDLPVLALLVLVPRSGAARWLTFRKAAVAALAGCVVLGLIARFDPLLKDKYYGHSNVASRMGLVNYHLFDIGSYAVRLASRAVPSGGDVARVNDWFRTKPAGSSPMVGQAAGKNVIYVQVESLQAFTLGLKVNGQEVTPNLNRLAKESMFFTDHYSQTGQGVTSDADLLGNCSLYPTRTGAVYYDYAANDFRCLPTLLREHGYHAVAMQGMPPDFWNLASVYPHVGFEHYYNVKEFTEDEKIGIGLSDGSFFRQVLPKLKALPEPYYAFLVTLTSHGPFAFEGLPHTLNLGSLEGTQAGNYLHAVHYTDGAIGQFVDALKAEGMLDKSIIVLDGDHAGVFRNNTGMSDLLHIAADDEVNLTRLEKQVPLIIRLPGGANAGERRQPAGQVDIAPTLAGLLGIPTNTVHFMGRDLMARQDGVIAFYTGSAMSAEHLFWYREDDPRGRCYDRTTGQGVAPADCTATAREAAKDLEIGRLIIERNLIPRLGRD
jgi:phosphoglycerol transferase MdoB-like AlkP superfamily enzyme